ncbi:MAG: porin family protein, partial [Gammaproteobacteria bacterium]|nr:porin family protein [Gammaproteobacteria bacterium]
NTPSVGDVKFVKNTQAIDLMGKGKLPVVDNFDLFAKVGMSYLTSNSDITGVSSANNLNLAYGAGADYYITPNVIVSAEWLRFNGNVKMDIDPSAPITNNKYQPYTDAFMVGLRYKFDM